MQWNGIFASWMCSCQICSRCDVMLIWTKISEVSSSLLPLWLKTVLKVKGVQPRTGNMYISHAFCSHVIDNHCHLFKISFCSSLLFTHHFLSRSSALIICSQCDTSGYVVVIINKSLWSSFKQPFKCWPQPTTHTSLPTPHTQRCYMLCVPAEWQTSPRLGSRLY